jgi:phosphoglycolate phosphatase
VLMQRMLKHTNAGCFYSLDEAVSKFLLAYKTTERSRVYPGVETGLARLAGAGIGLAVCTNKPQALAEECLRVMGLSPRFFRDGAVSGAGPGWALKPDVGHLQRAVKCAGGGMVAGGQEADRVVL